MWHVFTLSQKMKVRPSDLLALSDPYERYCVDECVIDWGVYVQSELDKIKHKKEKVAQGQKLVRLRQLLAATPTVQKFANPVATR